MTKEELKQEAEDNKPPYAYCALDTKCELWKDGFQKGAEPREKQIQIDAEQIRALQRQNGELTDELTKKADTNHQLVEQMAKLSEENAELKKQVEQKQHLADVRLEQSLENYKLFSDERKARIDVDIALEDMTDNLTKAKDIIKRYLTIGVGGKITQNYLDVTKEAEQFLKEE
jgi:hypothetical protein